MNDKENIDNIKVSIICIVYNHEKFLRKCLDGFVKQKTNFKFEAIIHDDCSTDNSKQIIEEYYKKYPEIIVPIYEKDNQFSKGKKIIRDIVYPRIRGKYVAICEGDDYWTDENKIQLQYDFMEKNTNCSLCVHNTIINDLKNNKQTYFNNWNNIHILNDADIFLNWSVHTSSYFTKKEYVIYPKLKNDKCFGDYKRLVFSHYYGNVICLPYTMSVYNFNNENGALKRNKDMHWNEKINSRNNKIKFLNDFNEYSAYKYSNTIQKAIDNEKMFNLFENSVNIKKYKDFMSYKFELKNNYDYKKLLNNMNKWKKKIYILVINNYLFFLIYNKLKRIKYGKGEK